MKTIALAIAEPRQWDSFYSTSGDADMVFCPTLDEISVGEPVRISLTFRGGPQFFITGVAMWRRPPGPGARRLRPGVGVRLNGFERYKISYISGFCRGGLLNKRSSPRIPVRLQVTYRSGGARRMNFTRDITETGILLGVAELLPQGTPVDLTIVPPLDISPIKLHGSVVRHVQDEQGRAMGIQLNFRDDEERRLFVFLVRDVERAFQLGKLDERHLAQ